MMTANVRHFAVMYDSYKLVVDDDRVVTNTNRRW
jgi:hypothetical protein